MKNEAAATRAGSTSDHTDARSGAVELENVGVTPNPMLLGDDSDAASSDDELALPGVRSPGSGRPLCRRRAPVLVGAALVISAVAVGVLIAVMTSRSSSMSIPDVSKLSPVARVPCRELPRRAA